MINWNIAESQRISQNAQNLILLRRFELPFCRRWGIDPDLIDMPENGMRPRAVAEAYELISSGEPRAAIESIQFSESGELVVTVSA